MSTRAHIIVKDENEKHYLYHHCDGYPEGVGAELRNIFKDLNDEERFDTADDFCEWISDYDNGYEYEDYGLHGDEDYVYVIDFPNNKFICYDYGWDESEEDLHEVVFEEPIYKEKENVSKNVTKNVINDENDIKYQSILGYYNIFYKIDTFNQIYSYFVDIWPELKNKSIEEFVEFLNEKKIQFENEIKNEIKNGIKNNLP